MKTYQEFAHAMQSGVAAMMSFAQSKETDPKHLRVGVNSAMVETSAIVQLLVDKGVITEQEWIDALTKGMEREAKSYERMLSKITGKTVTLG